MRHDMVSRDDVESIIPEEWGGMWFLNDGPDMESLGFALLALEPDGKNHAHNHAG